MIHSYHWTGTQWVEEAKIGYDTAYSATARFDAQEGQYPTAVYAQANVGGTAATAINAVSTDGTGLRAYSTNFYGIQATGGVKSPLLLTPSGSSSPPSHSAGRGSFWIDAAGNPYLNVTSGSGYQAWRTLGVAYTDLRPYAMANGSMCAFVGGGVSYLFVRANSAWGQVWSAE